MSHGPFDMLSLFTQSNKHLEGFCSSCLCAMAANKKGIKTFCPQKSSGPHSAAAMLHTVSLGHPLWLGFIAGLVLVLNTLAQHRATH